MNGSLDGRLNVLSGDLICVWSILVIWPIRGIEPVGGASIRRVTWPWIVAIRRSLGWAPFAKVLLHGSSINGSSVRWSRLIDIKPIVLLSFNRVEKLVDGRGRPGLIHQGSQF